MTFYGALPDPGFSSSVPLLAGDAGTAQTIAAIRDQVDEALRDPYVRQTAGLILRGVPPHDDMAETRAIYEWVLRHIRFVKDPVGKETISSARWTLLHRFGDCDDVNAILLPALLGVIGIRTRLVTISANPAAPEQFSHVYAEAFVHGRWIPVDAARPGARFGLGPPRWLRKRIWSLSSDFYEDVRGLNGYHLGFEWGPLIESISTGTERVIRAARTPRTALVEQPSYAPSYAPPPSPGIPVWLIGGGLLLGAVWLAKKNKGKF